MKTLNLKRSSSAHAQSCQDKSTKLNTTKTHEESKNETNSQKDAVENTGKKHQKSRNMPQEIKRGRKAKS